MSDAHFQALSRACPGAFQPGDVLPPSRIVPADFDLFLFSRCRKPKTKARHEVAYVIRRLHQLADYDGGTVVEIGTRALARELGIDDGSLRRVQRDSVFVELVDFQPGISNVEGAAGLPGRYDLARCFAEYGAWRRLRKQGNTPLPPAGRYAPGQGQVVPGEQGNTPLGSRANGPTEAGRIAHPSREETEQDQPKSGGQPAIGPESSPNPAPDRQQAQPPIRLQTGNESAPPTTSIPRPVELTSSDPPWPQYNKTTALDWLVARWPGSGRNSTRPNDIAFAKALSARDWPTFELHTRDKLAKVEESVRTEGPAARRFYPGLTTWLENWRNHVPDPVRATSTSALEVTAPVDWDSGMKF